MTPTASADTLRFLIPTYESLTDQTCALLRAVLMWYIWHHSNALKLAATASATFSNVYVQSENGSLNCSVLSSALCNHDSTWLVSRSTVCVSWSPRSPGCWFSGAAGRPWGDQCAQRSYVTHTELHNTHKRACIKGSICQTESWSVNFSVQPCFFSKIFSRPLKSM